MPLYDKSFILVVPTGNDPESSPLWVVPLYLKLKNLNFVADFYVSCFTFLKDNRGKVDRLSLYWEQRRASKDVEVFVLLLGAPLIKLP